MHILSSLYLVIHSFIRFDILVRRHQELKLEKAFKNNHQLHAITSNVNYVNPYIKLAGWSVVAHTIGLIVLTNKLSTLPRYRQVVVDFIVSMS